MGEHEVATIKSLIPQIVNVSLLVGFMVYKLKGPARDFAQSRHSYIREEIGAVAKELEIARSRAAEFAAKLKGVAIEGQAIKAQAIEDARMMRERITTDSKKLSAQIITDAQASAAALVGELKAELRIETGLKVLERAEQMVRIKLTSDDQLRIRQAFSRDIQ